TRSMVVLSRLVDSPTAVPAPS
ncbi:MAG: hypothetical protein QOE51_5003, partial [Actinoplanes sp.]|nr:hypothetical protein [Actinoplanes sp.]